MISWNKKVIQMKQKLIIRIISTWFFLYYLINEMFVLLNT